MNISTNAVREFTTKLLIAKRGADSGYEGSHIGLISSLICNTKMTNCFIIFRER